MVSLALEGFSDLQVKIGAGYGHYGDQDEDNDRQQKVNPGKDDEGYHGF